jgi:spore germination protein GerM
VRRRPTTTAAVVLALALVGAACGIPTDHTARPIDQEALPAALAPQTTTSLALAAGTEPVRIFLVRNDGSTAALAAVTMGIPDPKTPSDRISAVMKLLISEQPAASGATRNMTNTVPSSMRVLDIKIDGHVLNLDVSNLDNVESTQQRLAFAQMVYTVTDLPGIDAVRFWINHREAQVPLDQSTSSLGQAINRGDYSQLQSTH